MTRRFVIGLVLVVGLGGLTPPSWAIDYCFDFRATLGYVTDPANCSFEPDTTNDYPTVFSNGATAGYTANFPSGAGRDRDSTVTNKSLAGVQWQQNTGTQMTFRIDLPSTGTYNVRAAFGSASASDAPQIYADFQDGGVSFGTISGVTCTAPCWVDASGVARANEAAWNSSNATITHTFTSTTFTIVMGSSTAQSNFTYVSMLEVISAGGGGGTGGGVRSQWRRR